MRINEGFVELGELLEKGLILSIQDGNHGEKHPKATDYVDDGIPFIMANNLTHGSVDIEGASKIPFNQAEELRIGFSVTDDVLLTHKGTVGNTAIVGNVSPYIMLTPQVTYYRTNSKHLNNYYLLYCFRDINFQKILASLAQQSTRPYIGITAQRKLKIFFRDIRSQIKLVEKIKPYDDLIENNRRRIQLLEESARLLYKEWFVHLRFPGHEHVKIVDGVPEGWVKLSVKECCQAISYGYTASASEDNVGPKFLRITDIVPSSIDWDRVPFCEANESTKIKYKLDEGDIVVARTGATVGYAKRIPKLDFDVVYASYLVRFKPDPRIIDDLLLGIYMESNDFKNYVLSNSGGSAQPNANAQVLGSATLLVPNQNMQSLFRDSVKANFLQKQVLEKQTSSLIKARDLLLPRLMNGELTL